VPLSEDAGQRTANRLATEREKQKKDTEKAKKVERTPMMTMTMKMTMRRKRGSAASRPPTGMRWHAMMRTRLRATVHLRN
jgi:hypothetical protein